MNGTNYEVPHCGASLMVGDILMELWVTGTEKRIWGSEDDSWDCITSGQLSLYLFYITATSIMFYL